MDEALISTGTIAWLGFALGAVFGFTGNRTNFCTMGAISDIVNMGDWTRMRMWLLAIAVALLGVAVLQSSGQVDVSKSIYGGTRLSWLSHVVGGLMFGVGMVLSSGCGSKTLIRVGGGNLKSVLVLIVMGIAAFATLKGVFGVWRVATVDKVVATLPASQDLPSLLGFAIGVDPKTLALWLPLVIGLALLAFVFAHAEARKPEAVLGGIVIGLTIVGGWYVTGHVGFVAEHPQTLEAAYVGTLSNRPESLSLVAPSAQLLDLLMFWSDKSKFLSFGVAAALGIMAGSVVSALITKSYREEVFPNAADFKRHTSGAVLMGIGGVTGLGCTIGQGLTGISTLSLGSIITLAAIIVGAAAQLKYEYWKVMRE
ncbi:MAG: YeeE/YedE family protein [Burkholderiaceae bacterium]|nr:YeeE/YedE family protein [Burkholderiaceae bacterium]